MVPEASLAQYIMATVAWVSCFGQFEGTELPAICSKCCSSFFGTGSPSIKTNKHAKGFPHAHQLLCKSWSNPCRFTFEFSRTPPCNMETQEVWFEHSCHALLIWLFHLPGPSIFPKRTPTLWRERHFIEHRIKLRSEKRSLINDGFREPWR